MNAEGYQDKPFTSNAWKENNVSYHNSNSCLTSENTSKYDEVLKPVESSIEALVVSGFKLIKKILIAASWFSCRVFELLLLLERV